MNIDDLPDYAIQLASEAPRLSTDQLELLGSVLYRNEPVRPAAVKVLPAVAARVAIAPEQRAA